MFGNPHGCGSEAASPDSGGRWLSSQQRKLSGSLDSVAPPADAELAIHVPEVRLDGVDREVQLTGYLDVRHHRRQVAQDRLLALAQGLQELRMRERHRRRTPVERRDQLGDERAVRGA